MNCTVTNATSTQYPSLFSGYAHLHVAILGTLTNLILLVVWRFRTSPPGSRYESSICQNNHWFVAGMALSDMLYCLVHGSLLFDFYVVHSPIRTAKCVLLLLSGICPTTASSLNLLMLNVDKFIYLHMPLRYSRVMSRQRALVSAAMCWLVAFGWSLAAVFGSMSNLHQCTRVKVDHPMAYVGYSLLFFILPTACSFCISVYVAALVYRMRKETERRHSLIHKQSADKPDPHPAMGHLRTILFIFVATVWSTFTCLPYRFAYMLRQAKAFDPRCYLWVYFGLNVVMSLGAVGNPLIVLYTQPQYRRTLVWLFRRCFYDRFRGGARDESLDFKCSSASRNGPATPVDD